MQQQALEHTASKVATAHAHRTIEGVPVQLMITNYSKEGDQHSKHPFTLICQWTETRANPLTIQEWVFLPV